MKLQAAAEVVIVLTSSSSSSSRHRDVPGDAQKHLEQSCVVGRSRAPCVYGQQQQQQQQLGVAEHTTAPTDAGMMQQQQQQQQAALRQSVRKPGKHVDQRVITVRQWCLRCMSLKQAGKSLNGSSAGFCYGAANTLPAGAHAM
jgi:hypothetical protein